MRKFSTILFLISFIIGLNMCSYVGGRINPFIIPEPTTIETISYEDKDLM